LSTSEQSSGGGFFQRLIAIFTGGNDPEREKKRLLKDIAKSLNKQKYKFYKSKNHTVLSGLAQFFYRLYKLLGPAQVLLEHAESSGALKSILIESYLDERQKQQLERLHEDNIRAASEKTDVKTLASQLKEELVSFFSAFDSQKIKEINGTYNLVQVFLQLVNFDYYFLLKKFDSSLPERNFSYQPKFDSINGEYLSDDLKDFLSLLHLVDPDANWDLAFEVFKAYKGQDVVARAEWKKVLKAMVNVRNSNILLLIVKHIDQDPYYKIPVYPPKEKIVESYLTKMKTQTEMTIQKLVQEKRSEKIDKLASYIFGTPAVSRMKYYTEKANITYSKKMLGGFIYVQPMNYLKAFLLDYVKKDVKEIIDTLLIKGEWTTNVMSQQISESFHHLLEVSDQVLQFDESLAEEGEVGSKLKVMVTKSDRDQNSMTILKKLLKEVNDRAQLMIKGAAQSLIAVAKNIKLCIEDQQKQPYELIINWKDLDNALEQDIQTLMTTVYKKIYYFIQLLQFFIK
jgi:hypothetical protein